MPSDLKPTKEDRERERTLQDLRRLEPTSDINELHRRLKADPRFNPPTPSPWKRAALLVLMVGLLWLALSMRLQMKKPAQPEVLHAQRCVHAILSEVSVRLTAVEGTRRSTSSDLLPALLLRSGCLTAE